MNVAHSGRLVALIDEYKSKHGEPSDASIARAIGASRQTVSSWRKRGIRDLPEAATLRSLAAFIGRDYDTVILRAALLDSGYLQ
jgi:transcriptional regulator with XRE-family HTH domain